MDVTNASRTMLFQHPRNEMGQGSAPPFRHSGVDDARGKTEQRRYVAYTPTTIFPMRFRLPGWRRPAGSPLRADVRAAGEPSKTRMARGASCL